MKVFDRPTFMTIVGRLQPFLIVCERSSLDVSYKNSYTLRNICKLKHNLRTSILSNIKIIDVHGFEV
jgi:hypothetical protein